MRMIAIAKSPLQDAERRQHVRLLIATNMRFFLAPSIFQTALSVGWKGQRITARTDTLNFCISDTQQNLGALQPLALRFPQIDSAVLCL